MEKTLEDEINEWLDEYGFQVPYNGTNNFYNDEKIKHARAGIDFIKAKLLEENSRLKEERNDRIKEIMQMIEWRTNEVKFMNDALDRKQMGVVSEEVTRTTIRAHNITIQHLQSLLSKFEAPNTLTKEQMRQRDDLSEQREEYD